MTTIILRDTLVVDRDFCAQIEFDNGNIFEYLKFKYLIIVEKNLSFRFVVQGNLPILDFYDPEELKRYISTNDIPFFVPTVNWTKIPHCSEYRIVKNSLCYNYKENRKYVFNDMSKYLDLVVCEFEGRITGAIIHDEHKYFHEDLDKFWKDLNAEGM